MALADPCTRFAPASSATSGPRGDAAGIARGLDAPRPRTGARSARDCPSEIQTIKL